MTQHEKLTEKDVADVAALASLELTAAERERMLRDLNQILSHMDQLNELDTEGVPPMGDVLNCQLPASSNPANTGPSAREALQFQTHSLRDDKTRPSLAHDEAMRNAPDTDDTYFRVPKVIER